MGAVGQMGFPNRLITMSGFLIDEPGMRSGRHAHNEAVLYVAQGHGHTMIDGEKVPWQPGTSIHIPGPQTDHQHFNTGSEPAFTLRMVSGLRLQIEDAAADVFPPLWYEGADRIEPE
jgi:gentisate 1,2-dioxygenase